MTDMDFFYESEFETELLKFLSAKYSLSGNSLEEYLFYRYLVVNKIQKFNKVKLEDFAHFIAKELNLKEGNVFSYKGQPFYVFFSMSQSISNIIENQAFWRNIFTYNRVDNDKFSFIASIVKKAILSSRSKPSKYRVYVYCNDVLSQLNAIYGAKPAFGSMDNVSPVADGLRTLEEISVSMIQDMSFCTTNHKVVKEKDVEEYIFRNLKSLINVTPVSRQYILAKDCIADIFGYQNNCPVIIELKNSKDDRLLWQVQRYRHYMNDCQLVIIATEIDDKMTAELKKLSNIKVYMATPHINSGKVTNIALNLL